MVTEESNKYALRARYIRRGFEQQGDSKEASSGAADVREAAIAVGLKPKQMTKQERQQFSGRTRIYLQARNKILVQWWQDCTRPVSLRAMLDAAEDADLAVTKDAFYFLQENGYINFGVLPEAAEPAAAPAEGEAAAAAAAAAEDAAAAAEPEEDERAIVFKLYELLRAADMETTSEKALRKELQKHFKADISEKKQLVKEHVNYFIEHLEEKATLQPKGYEGQLGPAEAAAAAAKAKAKQAAAAAAAAAKRAAAAAPLPKPPGRVIVVGGGPAGLAAATVLKRNNVDVLVLEARDRVGGRVHSYSGPFAAPVDLGASLVTGTAPDLAEGLAPDPVLFVCKQLGIQLHTLGGSLPIFDAQGQQVTPETDEVVDSLRDDLLDAAREVADEDEAAAEKMSLGEALQQALDKRLGKPAAAAANGSIDAVANGNAKPAAAEEEGKEPVKVEAAAQPQQPDTTTESKEDTAGEAGAHAAAAVEPKAEPNSGSVDPAEQPKTAEAADANGTAAAAGAVGKGAVASEGAAAKHASYTAEQLELLDWHWANLEYGCSAALTEVSLPHWNQDEEWGGFGGPHAMVVGGFGQAMQGLAQQLGDALRLSTAVVKIEYSQPEQQQQQQPQEGADQAGTEKTEQPAEAAPQQQPAAVRVTTAQGEVLEAALVLVTLPLGVLKAGAVAFEPALPGWKSSVVGRMGFGDLNKVVLQFPEVFWDAEVDYFGVTQPAGPASRGRCFMFWNLARFNGGTPLLAGLVAGAAARAAEQDSQEELVEHTLQALRRAYGSKVQQPVAAHTTRWASEEFSRGSYSFVAVGCSGDDYDALALPVARRLLFAGEHTCKEHPDTVGGAMLSGMREAARALQLLRGKGDDSEAGLVSSRTETLSRADKRKRRKEEEEEEAGWESAEDEEEAEEGPGGERKKRKKDRQRDKKDRKEKKKDKKEKKEKKKRKDKGDDDGGASEDEEGQQQGAAGRRTRTGERRQAGMLPAEAASRAAAREQFRHDVTRLWRGLLDAQQGDVAVVNDVLSGCDSLDTKQQCIAAILRATPQALSQLSQDGPFLATLQSWLAELLPERSDANAHVLLKILELLSRLPDSSWALLGSCGLLDSIKAAAEHRNKEVAQAAAPIRKAWLAKNPSKPKPGQQQSAAAGPKKLALLNPEQQRKQQQQQKRPTSSGGAPASQPAAATSGAAGGAAAAADLAELLPDDERVQLEASQAALREAQAQAAAAAAELAQLQQQLPVVPHSGRISSFGEYKRTAKRQQADLDEEAQLEQQEEEAAAAAAAGSKRRKLSQEQQQGKPDGSGGSRPGSAAGSDAKEAATKQLRDFVKAQLKPRFQSKQLSSEDCKWVLAKVTEKVLSATTATDLDRAGDFVNAKREKKVAALVDSYVAKRQQERERKGPAAAGDAAAGDGKADGAAAAGQDAS
ncbi:hypothetical protein OEZ85_008331 [Tetradesmus obliquus]|uniref:SWIRM domain-containing protein n=1 Tax=Tetradesmus obliquus TaxID=3088 RepID=A0ABY8TN73_TETOB|nr:hypothetical protein OEZ85_008331 [Tetradesmus obliquus]